MIKEGGGILIVGVSVEGNVCVLFVFCVNVKERERT